jgi:DNA-binding NarL/FixJ family response regulator
MARYLGQLATTLRQWSAAEQHFQDALAMSTRMGARPFTAHTQYAYADMLLRRGGPGDRERAYELLTQSLATAQELGMIHLEQLTRPLVGRPSSDVTPTASPKNAAAQPFRLSPRELDVLRLIAEGRTDREIAEVLFISPRTVARHVSGVLNKLGVSSRSAATAIAIRRQLV